MAEQISFPLSSPQTQAAERIQNQLHHASANAQHAVTGELKRNRAANQETVNETHETENDVIDQEGHLGAEYQARKREGEDSQEEEPKSPSPPSDEDDFQGRFINVVV